MTMPKLPVDLTWGSGTGAPPRAFVHHENIHRKFLGVACVMKFGCGLTILMLADVGYWRFSDTGRCTVCNTEYDHTGMPLDPVMRLGAMHQRLKRGLAIPFTWRNPGFKPESVLP